jgi:hypothetical protein
LRIRKGDDRDILWLMVGKSSVESPGRKPEGNESKHVMNSREMWATEEDGG